MRAAIYVRVSTDEQAQSAEAQERDARRWCETHGWSVVEVYRDVGVSGAEWDTRPEIARARRDVERRPRPWDGLIVRDLDRIGRDISRTLMFVEVVLAHGARVFEYSTNAEAKGDPQARAMLAMRGVFAEMERGMIAARVRGDHEDRARRGVVTGGTVYGYRNERRAEGVVRVVHPDEAAVVREIFERRARGDGIRTITQDLNARAVPSPHAGRRGTGSWAPSTVHGVLQRQLYRGVSEWGRVRKSYRLGTKIRTRQQGPELTTEVPALRIVDEDLWDRAHARDNAKRVDQGRPMLHGRAKYLLTGHLRCAACGGPVGVRRGRWGTDTIPLYGCHWHRDRGDSVCAVASARPTTEVDRVVVEWISREVLSADVVRAVVAGVRREVEAMMSAEVDHGAVDRMRGELARIEGEAKRLAVAVAQGGDLEMLVTELRQRQARARSLREEIARAAAPTAKVAALDWPRVEREALDRMGALTDLFARDLLGAREVLEALLPTPLSFEPVRLPGHRGARWLLTGAAVTGGMFASPEGPGQTCTLSARLVA